jgi:hypothetical protein
MRCRAVEAPYIDIELKARLDHLDTNPIRHKSETLQLQLLVQREP